MKKKQSEKKPAPIRRSLLSATGHLSGSPVEARLTDQKAKPVDLREVEREFNSGYGIFSGTKLQWAKLRFAPSRARWIAQERWHPQQRGRLESDGSYVLELPYTDTRELMMDILKYGADVRVLGPRDLADTVAAEIRRMAVVL